MVWMLMMLEQWFSQRRVAVSSMRDGARHPVPARQQGV
jgi:hypothetical protein